MFRSDPSDELLIRSCAEFEALFRQFTLDCDILDKVEFSDEAAEEIAKIRDWEQHTVRQWRSVLRKTANLRASTKAGALAKMRVIRQCVDAGLIADVDAVAVLESLVLDLDLLFGDPDCSCKELRTSLS